MIYLTFRVKYAANEMGRGKVIQFLTNLNTMLDILIWKGEYNFTFAAVEGS